LDGNVGRLLRESMERFTGGRRVPADPARSVVRQHRRRIVVLAAAACVAVGGTALGLAASGHQAGGSGAGTRGGTRPLHAYTVAYVLHRSAQAASQQHLVEYSRSVDLVAAARAVNLYELDWAYGIEFASSTGSQLREVIESGKLQAEYASTWGDGRLTSTAVEYQTQTWYQDSEPYAYTPAPTGCATASPSDFYAFLSWGLRCVRDLKIVGQARIDGVQTLEIVSVSHGPDSFSVEFWVNPQTYLPVRALLNSQDTFPAVDRVDEYTDYQWLAPTTANLAKLAIRIPAGFRWDRLQPQVYSCGFIACN
jgi:hypothetical protein